MHELSFQEFISYNLENDLVLMNFKAQCKLIIRKFLNIMLAAIDKIKLLVYSGYFKI